MTDIKRRATDKINDALGMGRIPWRNPVRVDNHCGMPLNIETKGLYRGVNTLLLWDAVQRHSFASRWFGTEDDWARNDATLTDEARGIPVVNYNDWTDSIVYNLDQVVGCDGYRPVNLDIVTKDSADFTDVERLIRSTGANIIVGIGDRGHPSTWNGYVAPNPWLSFPNHTKGDYILMGKPANFASMASYNFTILHELVHWAEVRTNWVSAMNKREMVAEIASAWLAQETDCPMCPCMINHRKYELQWRGQMMQDDDFLFEITTQAWHVVDCVMSSLEDRSRTIYHDPDTVELPPPNFARA